MSPGNPCPATCVLSGAALAGGPAAAAATAAASLPFKLVHAAWLLEYGLVSKAAAYCSSLQTALAGFPGNKVPPSLMVTRTLMVDLADRIRQHAAVRIPPPPFLLSLHPRLVST